MITKRQYVQYLISTPVNYTRTNFADHLEGTSHDAVNDYLRRQRHTARQIWDLAEPLIDNRPGNYLILDDSVQDKRHSRVMELVKRQYSGNEQGLVKGIGIVNLVHSDGTDHYPIDFRVYAPEVDDLTQNEHFRDMLREAYRKKGIQARTRAIALCGCWTGMTEEQAQAVLIVESGAEFTTADAVTRRAVMA